MKYTGEQLESIASRLKEKPPIEKKKQEHSKQEAVKILSKEIAALQKRGYTLDQISEMLKGEGLDIATPTLKNYLQRAKSPAKKVEKAPTPPANDTPAVSANGNGAPTVSAGETPFDASKGKFNLKADTENI
jgi:hypothetical protein